MKCNICKKPCKENTEGNKRYCQGHSLFDIDQKIKRLKDAMDYLDFCEHAVGGIDIEGMSDDEIIEYADNLSERGELAYDAWKENGGK